MHTRRALVALLALPLALLLPGCGDDPAPRTPPTAPAGADAAAPTLVAPATATPPTAAKALGAEDLKAHFERMVEAGKKGERETVERLAGSLVPTQAELRSVLRAGEATEAFLAAYKGPVKETLPPPDPLASPAVEGKRSVIVVHAATTEELAAYARGTTAFLEFPGGMKRFAERVAAPGRTWYAVEALEPGHDSGTRFTCLTALADRFVLVVKPWRALEREEEPKEGGSEAPK